MNADRYLVGDSEFIIARDFGCNLFSWKMGGDDILYHPPGFSSKNLACDPTEYYQGGNPLLFPSVGRTWDTTGSEPQAEVYRIDGVCRSYKMPIHGVVPYTKWRTLSETRNHDCVSVEYECVVPEEVTENYYPWPVDYVQSYTLYRRKLELRAVFHNKGSKPAPVAFGYHPYFQISNTSRSGVEIRLPCREELTLDQKLLVPDGNTIRCTERLQLQAGKTYDNAYCSLAGTRTSLTDENAGRTVHIDFDENIAMLVVSSPQDSPFVCLEPWTQGLGAYPSLRRENWEQTDVTPVLLTGEIRTVCLSYTVEA